MVLHLLAPLVVPQVPAVNILDVNQDGAVNAIDASVMIAFLETESRGATSGEPLSRASSMDTNSDGIVSPIDLFRIINAMLPIVIRMENEHDSHTLAEARDSFFSGNDESWSFREDECGELAAECSAKVSARTAHLVDSQLDAAIGELAEMSSESIFEAEFDSALLGLFSGTGMSGTYE